MADRTNSRIATVKKVAAWILIIVALLGFLGAVFGPPTPDRTAGIVMCFVFAVGGYFLLRSAARSAAAQREVEEQEQRARIAALQQPVIDLAMSRQGVLTVTDVVADLDYPVDRAEEVLKSLDDGVRVCSNVTDQGVIVYEFREVMHRLGRPTL